MRTSVSENHQPELPHRPTRQSTVAPADAGAYPEFPLPRLRRFSMDGELARERLRLDSPDFSGRHPVEGPSIPRRVPGQLWIEWVTHSGGQVRVHSPMGSILPAPSPPRSMSIYGWTRCGGEGWGEGAMSPALAPSPRPSPPQWSPLRMPHRLWGRGGRESGVPPLGECTRQSTRPHSGLDRVFSEMSGHLPQFLGLLAVCCVICSSGARLRVPARPYPPCY